MREAMFAVLAFLTCIGVGCQHNMSRNGCGHSCNSCGQAANTCEHCGGTHGLAGGLGHGGGLGQGDGLGHGDGNGLGLRSGAPAHVARMPHGNGGQEMMGPPGPPTGSYAYPYYTIRAPRDFLLNNPPSIGP